MEDISISDINVIYSSLNGLKIIKLKFIA